MKITTATKNRGVYTPASGGKPNHVPGKNSTGETVDGGADAGRTSRTPWQPSSTQIKSKCFYSGHGRLFRRRAVIREKMR